MRILAVAQNTFREAIRDKVLYVLLFFAAAAILGSKAIGWVSIGQDIKIMKDISLAAVLVFGVLIAIFVGTNLVYKEIDKRTLYTIISRPMRRYEFILGKYFGLAFVLALVTFIMTAAGALYVVVLGGTVTLAYFLAALLIYWELLVITAFAVLLSVLTSPILGALIVFSVFLFGHATNILVDLPQQLESSAARHMLHAVYYIVPNLSNFNIRAEAANAMDVSLSYVAWAMTYGAIYTALLLFLAALAFEEKDV
jgi:ABC-type transport system involved in multi-copper enzyme maturation permease subunit